MAKEKIWVVVPNYNGEEIIKRCLDSLQKQTIKPNIVVVDNGSTDSSKKIIKKNFPKVTLIENIKNLGFAEGVNIGIRIAMTNGADCVALFNSDAHAEKNWLEKLFDALNKKDTGIVTGTVLQTNTNIIDNTGENFSIWGVPYARMRNTHIEELLDSEYVFGASGGSTLYRVKMLKQVGLFDKNMFAYYEDADINWRAQLRGWKVWHQSDAIVYHDIGGTSGKMPGFTVYQTIKNMPWVVIKNIPLKMLPSLLPRFTLLYFGIVVNALFSKNFFAAIRGLLASIIFIPKKLHERRIIQKNKTVSDQYLKSLLTPNLPPNSKLNKIF